jgi:thiamine biosynthesis lipoprotein
MGSPCEIQIFASSPQGASRAASAAIADIQRLEARFSRYQSDSVLSRINAVAARGGSTTVDEETAELLNYASTCHEQSGGLFDVTSGILRRAWRFDAGTVPDAEAIARLVKRIGWSKVRWKPPLLSFPTPDMEIDLGGIVKEYAVDRVAVICRGAGVRHGIVNLGGDVRVIGARPGGEPWRVGIRDPRGPDAITTVSMSEGALASSGDYERCIVVEGMRYGHILNPRTGWPVRHLAAVSVIADQCIVAGSASTIAMLKERDGPAWLDALGLPHLWVSVDREAGGPLAGATAAADARTHATT